MESQTLGSYVDCMENESARVEMDSAIITIVCVSLASILHGLYWAKKVGYPVVVEGPKKKIDWLLTPLLLSSSFGVYLPGKANLMIDS